MSGNLPVIVLVGRPNVGKSTMFNRLIRSNRAITHDMPGITRDRMEGTVLRPGLQPFTIVDTGGLTLDEASAPLAGPDGIRGFESEILSQTESALEGASAVAMVVDGRDGLLPLDEHLAGHLRKKGLPTLLLVNKVDGLEHEDVMTAEFHSLGLDILPVSAEHGVNMQLLVEKLAALLPEDSAGKVPEKPVLRLAMLGRPNVGKSSLVNAMSGKQRQIVSDQAGTTRDSVDVRFTRDGKEYVFVDTAGVRRRTKVTEDVERYSVNGAIKSGTKADITLMVLDATSGLGQQDKKLIDMLDRRKQPFIVLVNKADLLTQAEMATMKKDLTETLAFCKHIPVLSVSAISGTGLGKILPLATKVHQECGMRIGTGQLNRAMEEVLRRHQPPVVRQVRAKFFYLTQPETLPPTFVFFVSDATRVPESYARYLERSLRKLFGIDHAPMRIRLRSSHKK